MAGFLLTFATPVLCSHGGLGTPQPPASRVFMMNVPVVTFMHSYAIVGCGFPAATLGAQPPCVTGKLTVGATRLRSMGMPVALLPESAGGSMGLPNPTPLILAPSGLQRARAM
jgi:hypothetical protein